MANEQSAVRERTNIDLKTPRRYVVIFLNDDFTSMEFVVSVLIKIFCKGADEAEQLMLEVHNDGHAVIGVYSYDIARTRTERAIELARSQGFPLRIIYRPE